MLPNPFVYVDSLKSASLGAGFDFVCPDSVEGYSSKDISYIKNDLIQVVFREGEKSLCLRKARGCDDVSGDYNIYKKVESHSVNGLDVTVKSNADGLYVSIWNNGQFAFAVNSNSPLSERFMDYLISQMK